MTAEDARVWREEGCAAGYGGEDVHVGVGGDWGFEAVEVADVAAVEHDCDEASDHAGFVEQSVAEGGVLLDQTVDDCADGGRWVVELDGATAD